MVSNPDALIIPENEMLELALTYKDMYEKMDKGSASNVVVSEENVVEILEHIAGFGYSVTGTYQDMRNYEQFENFLFQAQEGAEGYATYYSVHSDGGFSRSDFHSADEVIYETTASLHWDDEANPFVRVNSARVLDEWEYTSKGYFIYEAADSLFRYAFIRVKPLGQENLELLNTYIRPIGYVGNNLFLIDWDQSNMAQVAFNDLYENLYYIETGIEEWEWAGNDVLIESIPAEQFEPLFMKYFGVAVRFLQENAVYYKDKNQYFWERLSCGKHDIWFPAAEPEVVDNRRNEDGTITMIVDAVDSYRNNERAFTHEVTVRISRDGSFQYVSNHIRPDDKENVPYYRPRSQPLN